MSARGDSFNGDLENNAGGAAGAQAPQSNFLRSLLARQTEKDDALDQAQVQQSIQEQIIVTSARRVTKILQTVTSSQRGLQDSYRENQAAQSDYVIESQEKAPAPVQEGKAKHAGEFYLDVVTRSNEYNIDCFTEDGDILVEDEADIPESARAVSSKLMTPVFIKKSKNAICMSQGQVPHQRALSWNHRQNRQYVGQLDTTAAMHYKNPFLRNEHHQGSRAWAYQQDSSVLLSNDRTHDDMKSLNETKVTAINVQVNDIKIQEKKVHESNECQSKSGLKNQIKQRNGSYFGKKVPMLGQAPVSMAEQLKKDIKVKVLDRKSSSYSRQASVAQISRPALAHGRRMDFSEQFNAKNPSTEHYQSQAYSQQFLSESAIAWQPSHQNKYSE